MLDNDANTVRKKKKSKLVSIISLKLIQRALLQIPAVKHYGIVTRNSSDYLQRSMASQGDALNFSLRQETEEEGGVRSSVEDGASEGLDEPKLGVIGSDTLEFTDAGLSSLSLGDSVARSLEADGEIHTENTCGGVVLNSEIDMFVDTKSEVT